MKKNQISLHSDGFGRESNPAINVKCRNFPCTEQIKTRFECSEITAHQAVMFAYDSAVEQFWNQIQELANHYLGKGYKVYSEGRSNGWLVVHGMPPVESWDAILVSKWARFSKAVAADIAYRCDPETVFADIEANEWWKDGAEAYNMIDIPGKNPVCVADLKAQAIKAGFGAVIR